MAGEDYVPRPEYELLARTINGSLARIEASVTATQKDMALVRECVNDRVTWDAHDRHKAECKKEMDKMRGRPSWAVSLIIGFLASSLATTITLLLTGVIK